VVWVLAVEVAVGAVVVVVEDVPQLPRIKMMVSTAATRTRNSFLIIPPYIILERSLSYKIKGTDDQFY
jgi:hypothetical protein